VLAANNLGFIGLALSEICQTFGQQPCQEGMACPKSATHSIHSMVTSLIGPIWRGMKWSSSGIYAGMEWLNQVITM
jgi:hypothetical protein